MFGFLNIYKPKGKTSHDVVAILRRITKIKQIGHTGTLDPFAEGVLPICIGKATRLIEFLEDDKAYIGTIKLGESTTTYDVEGEIVNKSEKNVDISEIENVIEKFKGEIEQLPPIYSAIKVNGKKLYEYARQGQAVDIAPRKVIITDIHIVNYDSENRLLELYIACSKGTYIRSIANDIGEMLGCYGHLIKLVRVKAGKFSINKAITLEECDSIEKVKELLQNPLDFLDYPQYELNADELKKVSNGMGIKAIIPDGICILTNNNIIISIAEANSMNVKMLKVFN